MRKGKGSGGRGSGERGSAGGFTPQSGSDETTDAPISDEATEEPMSAPEPASEDSDAALMKKIKRKMKKMRKGKGSGGRGSGERGSAGGFTPQSGSDETTDAPISDEATEEPMS